MSSVFQSHVSGNSFLTCVTSTCSDICGSESETESAIIIGTALAMVNSIATAASKKKPVDFGIVLFL